MQDRRAQADLLHGIVAALTYTVAHASFAGFSADAARAVDPSIRFNDGPTVFGEVSIREASKTAILLTTESGSGAVFCMVKLMRRAGPESVSQGSVDAKSISDCVGGWPG